MDMEVQQLMIANAAGMCKTLADVTRFAKIPVSSYVTVGSISLLKLPGNPEPRVYDGIDGLFFNSIGLENGGIPFYMGELKEMLHVVSAAGKKLRVSIVGDRPEEYSELARLIAPLAHTIEINAGCPNVWKDGEQKKIPSFDLKLLEEIIDRVCRGAARHGPRPEIALKLSPYSDPGMIAEVAQTLKRRPRVNSLVLCNTFPNALPLDKSGKRTISGKGYAGMSGRNFKPIALGQVAQFREHLPEMRITGVGGIYTALDIRDFLEVGANDVQIGTACYLLGERVIQGAGQEYMFQVA